MGICKDWHSSQQASPLSSFATPGASGWELVRNWATWNVLENSTGSILCALAFLVGGFRHSLGPRLGMVFLKNAGTRVVVFLLKFVSVLLDTE